MSDSPITPKDEKIKQSVHRATDKAIDVVSGAAQKAQAMGAQAKEAVTEKFHEVQDKSRIAQGRAEAKVGEAKQYFDDKAGRAKSFAEEKVEQAKDFAEETTDKMKDLLADGAEKIKNLTAEAADKIKGWADRDKP